MKTWKKISSKKVYASPFFTIYEDDVITPDGSKSKYYYRKSRPAVAIVPFDGKQIYLVNQHRYAMGKRMWEVPIGGAENRNFLQQAKKELKEETGITAKTWKYLGDYVPMPSGSNAVGKIFLAMTLSFGKPQREGSESDMTMAGFSLKQIEKMIKNGEINDAPTISSIYHFKLL